MYIDGSHRLVFNSGRSTDWPYCYKIGISFVGNRTCIGIWFGPNEFLPLENLTNDEKIELLDFTINECEIAKKDVLVEKLAGLK